MERRRLGLHQTGSKKSANCPGRVGPKLNSSVHLGGVWHHPVAAVTLGAVERLIGALDDSGRIILPSQRGETDGNGDVDLTPALLNRKRLGRDPPPQAL